MSDVVVFHLKDAGVVEVVLPGGAVIVLPDGRCGIVDGISSVRPATAEEERSLSAAEADDEREGGGPTYLDLSG